MRWQKRVMVLASVAFIALFSYGADANASHGAKPSRPQSLTPTNVVIKVNGESVTKAEYDRYIQMLHALYCNRHKKASDRQKNAMLAKIRRSAARPIIQRLVVKTKLADLDVANLPEVEARMRKDYVKAFGSKGSDFAEIEKVAIAGGFGDLFKRDFALDVRLNSAFATIYSNELAVTEADIEKVRRDVADYNARAAATNKLHEALAETLIKKARSGEVPFAELADKYSQDDDKEPGGAMGENTAVDLSDEGPAYWEKLNRMKAGEVSDLLVTSEGYEIVKVNRRISPDESSSGEPALDLSRIFLRKAYEFPPQSEDEFRAEVVSGKREKFFRAFLVKLVKESEITYPSGAKALR